MLSQREYFVLKKIKDENLKYDDIDKIVYDGKKFTPMDVLDYRNRGLLKKASSTSDFNLDLTDYALSLITEYEEYFKDSERKEKSLKLAEEANNIAKNANKKSRNSNIIAIVSLAIAIISIVVSIILACTGD